MKYVALILLLLLPIGSLAQKPKPKSPPKKSAAVKPVPTPTPTPLSEKEQFEKASAHELAVARVTALEEFMTAFPESEHRPAASDLLASSRALIAEEKILSGDAAGAVTIYRRLIEEAPQPIPAELFKETIVKIPSTLFWRGQRTAASELATLIENRVENDVAQLLELANFYLSIENGAEAMRVTAKAAAKDPASAAVHRTLALAHRINFDLELSTDSYAKALELEPESGAAKRGLAEMKRALGKSAEAITLYRELLATNDSDSAARTGLVLSLFDADRRAEAETELSAALEKTPGNVVLLSGAAYWYASRGIGDKAVELAQKAIDREPRYVWSHIALARGLMSQRKPVAAEKVLVKARAYGNFPTLEYELASARVAAGFFRDAAEDLAKQFTVSETGVATRLGGRLAREEKTLADLVAYERKASIFTPRAADSTENSEILRALLDFDQKLKSPQPDEAAIAAAADAFVSGSDKMKIHRQMYAAGSLLEKKVALGKVLELTKAATGNTDTGLEVPDPAAAVMAVELYEPRIAAFRRNDFLLVPEVPRQTLSAILRGRVEEITGWALYQQDHFADATIRLRRAISVMPADSAWWRSSMWRLGAALAADGKDTEALNAYIESYKTDRPDFGKYAVVETLYRKVHGTIDGLEAKIGSDHVATLAPVQEIKPASMPVEVPTSTSSTENSIAVPVSEPTPVTATSESANIEPETKPVKVSEKTDADVIAQPAPEKTEPETAPSAPAVETSASPEPAVQKAVDPLSVPAGSEEKVTEEKTAAIPAKSPTAEIKPAEQPPTVEKTVDIKPAEESPTENKTADIKPAEESPTESKTADIKPAEQPPTVEKTVDIRPAAQSPTESKTADIKPAEQPPTVEKTVDIKPAPTEEKPVDIKPTEQPPTEEKTVDIKPTAEPATKTVEEQPVEKPVENRTVDAKPAERDQNVTLSTPPTEESKPLDSPVPPDRKTGEASGLLFEPIIITIPSRRSPPKPASDTTKGEARADDPTLASGAARRRLIEGETVRLDEPAPCEVEVSLENISLINNGGNVGLLVNLKGPGDIRTLTTTSSSPKDIEIILEPEIGGVPDRRFYVIRSISPALGVYQVTFAAPCGKKEVVVSVR